MHLQLRLQDLDASILIANGQIDYAKPVAEEIVVRCSFGGQEAAMDNLQKSGEGRFQLTSEVLLNNGSSAGSFSGLYAVRLKR